MIINMFIFINNTLNMYSLIKSVKSVQFPQPLEKYKFKLLYDYILPLS